MTMSAIPIKWLALGRFDITPDIVSLDRGAGDIGNPILEVA